MPFSFEFVNKQKISTEITRLNQKKTCQENYIPVKLIQVYKDFFSYFIFHNFNNSMFSSNYASNLKPADILPTHQQKKPRKVGYRELSSK